MPSGELVGDEANADVGRSAKADGLHIQSK
jgi:hypothetical protein